MYNKLFTRILDSSIWMEALPTRIVWITLLAVMDEDGFCQLAAIGNLANRARVTVDQAKKAVAYLEAPDLESSDPAHEGRRIERVPGGWMVLNAAKYQHLATRENIKNQTRSRVQRFREKKAGQNNPPDDDTPEPVTHGNASVTHGNARETTGNNEKRTGNEKVTRSDTDTDTYTYTKKIKTVCAEPAKNADSTPPVLVFPVVGLKGPTWALTEAYQQKLQIAFPALDVLVEARHALAWLDATPAKRKTADGMKRFLVHWLGKSTNQQGYRPMTQPIPIDRPATVDWWAECKRLHGVDDDGIPVCQEAHHHRTRMARESHAEAV